ncbi:MAG: O-antigen ligase family protein [Clostridiales bacterium]|jgi:O-antigen ligase|nr:O-antigen ligase family protein [Clostridiales bacterium]
MVERSFFYGIFIRFGAWISLVFRASLFGRGIIAIGDFFVRIWRGSLAYRLVIGEGVLERGFRPGIFAAKGFESRILTGAGAAFAKITRPILRAVGYLYNNSLFFRKIFGFFYIDKNIADARVNSVEIGIFAAAFLMPLLPTMLILGLLAAITVIYFIKVFVTAEMKISFNYIDVFVLVFAALIAYGLVISYNIASSAPVAVVYILFVLFYFVVKNTINTKAKLMGLAATIATSGALVALYGIWQRATGNFVMTQAWLDEDIFGTATVRIYSTLDNPNVLGGYLILITILAFAMIYYYKDYIHKFFALGIFGVAGLCMVLTHSRGAWLGLIFAAAIFALMRDRRLVFFGIAALIAAPFLIPPEILYRFLSIGDLADTSTSYRLSIWMGAIDMLRVFWPIGIGQGVENFNFIYNMYAFSAVFTQHSHNLYLQIMIYWGISGIILFLLIMGGFFKGLFQTAARAGPSLKTLAAAIAAGMAGFLLKGLTDNVWYNFRVLAFFWLIVAVGAIITSLEVEKNEREA